LRLGLGDILVVKYGVLATGSGVIEQLRLVNTLCWAKNVADGIC
jgi:hypothetical protein